MQKPTDSMFSWLNDLVQELPTIQTTKKNLIQIAGYPNRENVNSNFLAFYFNEHLNTPTKE